MWNSSGQIIPTSWGSILDPTIPSQMQYNATKTCLFVVFDEFLIIPYRLVFQVGYKVRGSSHINAWKRLGGRISSFEAAIASFAEHDLPFVVLLVYHI